MVIWMSCSPLPLLTSAYRHYRQESVITVERNILQLHRLLSLFLSHTHNMTLSLMMLRRDYCSFLLSRSSLVCCRNFRKFKTSWPGSFYKVKNLSTLLLFCTVYNGCLLTTEMLYIAMSVQYVYD